MTDAALEDASYLDVSDPNFSIRSQAVAEARTRNWYARTPYGLAVLRYDEVQKMLRHPKLRQGSHLWPQHNGVTTGKFAQWWCNMLLCVEGDTHGRLRRMANPAFSPRLIADLQPKFQSLANRLIDSFIDRGTCDFIAEFSEPYATGVICDLLGLPAEKWRELVQIAADMGLALGVTFKEDVPDVRNSKVYDIVNELRSFGFDVVAHDPYADAHISEEHGAALTDFNDIGEVDAVIMAVSHKEFRDGGWPMVTKLLKGGKGIVMDVRGFLDRTTMPDGITLWRL